MVLIGVYLTCFLIGLGWALVTLFLGDLFGDHDVDLGGHDGGFGGHDMDAGGHDGGLGGHDAAGATDTDFDSGSGMHLSPFSPMIVSTFLATFGGVGLIVNYFHPSLAGLTAFPAAVIGLALAAAVMVGFNTLSSRVEGSSQAFSGQLIGMTAVVTTPIREGGVGEISYVARGSRYIATARSANGGKLDRNTQVLITDIQGSTFFVEPLLRSESEEKAP